MQILIVSKIDAISRHSLELYIPWREFEMLLDYYFDSLLVRNRKEAQPSRDALTKTIEQRCQLHTAVMKIDLDWAMLQVLYYDAGSGRNYPRQFYLLADVGNVLIVDEL